MILVSIDVLALALALTVERGFAMKAFYNRAIVNKARRGQGSIREEP